MQITGRVIDYCVLTGLSQIEYMDGNQSRTVLLDLGREYMRGSAVTFSLPLEEKERVAKTPEEELAERYRNEEPYRSRELT